MEHERINKCLLIRQSEVCQDVWVRKNVVQNILWDGVGALQQSSGVPSLTDGTETHQSMLADPAIRSLPGLLGPEECRPENSVGRGRGDCDDAHEILKTNIYHIYISINSIYQT